MLEQFNRVSIKKKIGEGQFNLHIALHPFPCSYCIKSFSDRNDFRMISDEDVLPEWQKNLAVDLFDNIPGIKTLFFSNGEITIQHSGAFSDDEIFDGALQVIKPYIEENLKLSKLLQ